MNKTPIVAEALEATMVEFWNGDLARGRNDDTHQARLFRQGPSLSDTEPKTPHKVEDAEAH